MTPPKPKVGGERRMLDYPHLATYLDVGITKAKELARDGAFPKIKIGGSVRFDKVDVDTYIERLKKSA
jgi:excisionase family DNA binding protein